MRGLFGDIFLALAPCFALLMMDDVADVSCLADHFLFHYANDIGGCYFPLALSLNLFLSTGVVSTS